MRETFASFLVGSNIETIDLKARLDGLALDEAKKRECDFVLYTTLIRKRSSSSGSGGGALESIVGSVGGGGTGSKLPGSKTAQDVASQASKVSARPVVAKTTKGKVMKDNEDVLTPMIESAAQAIVDATVKN